MTNKRVAVLVRGWPDIDTFSAIVIRANVRKQSPSLVLALAVSEIEARLAVMRWNEEGNAGNRKSVAWI